MRYLTKDNTLFSNKQDAEDYENYFLVYAKDIKKFINDEAGIRLSDDTTKRLARYLFKLIEDEDFNYDQPD